MAGHFKCRPMAEGRCTVRSGRPVTVRFTKVKGYASWKDVPGGKVKENKVGIDGATWPDWGGGLNMLYQRMLPSRWWQCNLSPLRYRR